MFGDTPDPLGDQTDYSSHLLAQYEGLLAAVQRVDQKYGPYPEFRRWREEAQGYPLDSGTCVACGRPHSSDEEATVQGP